jgi:hypothetical protein
MKLTVVQTLITTIACTTLALAAEPTPVAGTNGASAAAGNPPPAIAPIATAAQAAFNASMVSNSMVIMTRFLSLTEKQQEDIRRVQIARMDAYSDFTNKRRAIYLEQRASTNRAELASRLTELSNKAEAANHLFDDQSKAMLTPEQSARWIGLGMYPRLYMMYKSCALTSEQDLKVQELCILHGGQKPSAEPGTTSAWTVVTQEIENRILTEKQRDDFRISQIYSTVIGRFGPAGLTPEQDTAIRTMIKELVPRYSAMQSDPKATYALQAKLVEDIRAEILTDEQRTKIAPVKGASMPFPAVSPTPKADAPAVPAADAAPAPRAATPVTK